MDNGLWKALKGLLYLFLIGSIFYAGGYGWALFFAKKDESRTRVANYNMLILVIEILIILVWFINYCANNNPESQIALLITLLNVIAIHGTISFIGSIFYVFWYLFGRRID